VEQILIFENLKLKMMSTKKLITSRDPKGLHATGVFEAAYNKSKLDEDQA